MLDTSLLLKGRFLEIVLGVLRAGLGIWLVVAGLQGYLQGVGRVRSLLLRALLSAAGLAIAFSFLFF